ncbi:MAG: hypothetical protein WCD42_05400 [Rhizomicrobium sp.]
MKPRAYGEIKTVVSQAVDEAGGVVQAAALLQLSPQSVYGYTDPRDKPNMSLEQARMITRFGKATAFAEDFAALAGGSFVPGEGCANKSIGEYTIIANRDVTHLVGLLVAALEDGRIDDAERAALLPVVDTLHKDITSLRNRLRTGEHAMMGAHHG